MNEMIHVGLLSKEKCCGCTACYSICTRGAISMKRDEQGFSYPEIDENLCTQCGLCVRTCPSLSPKFYKSIKCFGAKHINKQEQLSSTSGGFAAALSDYVIGKGGVVYGVALDDVKYVRTVRINSRADLPKLKGSKYVQTDPCETFRQAGADLKYGLFVAYFGTSCNIDGLRHYLLCKNISTSNLVTIDLICHGVPSPQIFEDYIDYLSKRKPVNNFYFRTKAKGWGFGSKTFSPSVCYSDGGNVCDKPITLAYQQLFFSNNCLRPHCYECPYAQMGRAADFTIADFWGISIFHPQYFDKDGVSLVLINSNNALNIFNNLQNIDSFETTTEIAYFKQENQRRPSQKNSAYEQFWKDYHQKGIEYILQHYTILNKYLLFKYYTKEKLNLLLNKICKKRI